MRLFIVRHGETEHNARGIIQGHGLTRLSDRGRKQAALVAERLASAKPDAIFTSDLPRARETADEIARKHPGVPLIEDKRLREHDFGELEGQPSEGILADMPNWHPDYKPGGGESTAEVRKRARQFYQELLAKGMGTVIVVTHGILVRALVGAATGKEARFKTKNTGVTEIRIGKSAEVVCVNCDKHLAGHPGKPMSL